MEENVKTAPPAPEVTFDISLNSAAIKSLKSIVKWSNILVNINYAMIGVSLVFSFLSTKLIEKAIYLTGQQMPPQTSLGFFINILFSIIGGAIVIVPIYFLQKFSKKAKQALESRDETLLSEAFADQDKFFQIATCYILLSAFFIVAILIGLVLILFMVD